MEGHGMNLAFEMAETLCPISWGTRSDRPSSLGEERGQTEIPARDMSLAGIFHWKFVCLKNRTRKNIVGGERRVDGCHRRSPQVKVEE